jgi:hypothetical protein
MCHSDVRHRLGEVWNRQLHLSFLFKRGNGMLWRIVLLLSAVVNFFTTLLRW